jgi:hypothetical protein
MGEEGDEEVVVPSGFFGFDQGFFGMLPEDSWLGAPVLQFHHSPKHIQLRPPKGSLSVQSSSPHSNAAGAVEITSSRS